MTDCTSSRKTPHRALLTPYSRVHGHRRSRRTIRILLGLLLLGSAQPVAAIGSSSKLRLAQLRYRGGNAAPRPLALERLAWEIDKRTSIDVAPSQTTLTLSHKDLFAYPLLYLSGDQAFPLPSEAELQRLRNFLVYGGFLLIDSAEAEPGGGFDRSVRKLLRAVLPNDPLQRLEPEHTVHRSFYLLERASGRVALVPYLEGISRDGHLLVLYSQNDLAGAWARDRFGQWEHNVHPGGEHQRELAFRWGINIVMYALCLDYKADQVHIPFILHRRQWRVDSPADLRAP